MNSSDPGSITKADLIANIANKQLAPGEHTHLEYRDIESAVRSIVDQIAQTLERSDRVEIRGFGSFSLHRRPPRLGRNPKTGDPVHLGEKYVPHFKAGKVLRDRIKKALD